MIYRCDAVHDDPCSYVVVLSGGGDVIRLQCPPHEFGPFVPEAFYEITVEKADLSKAPIDRRA